MKTVITIAASAVLAGAVYGDHSSTRARPRLTGTQLVDQLTGISGIPKENQDANTIYAQRYAEGYLAGAADAVEGKSWCAPTQFKVPEIDDRAFAELKRLPRDGLRGNAAALVIEQLGKKFPCGATRGAP